MTVLVAPAGSRAKRFTDYDEQDDTLVIPEDLTILSDEDLSALSTQATEAFNAIFQDGAADLSTDDLTTLSGLTEGIEALNAETGVRAASAQTRRDEAAALAARVNPAAAEDENSADEDHAEDAEADDEDADGTDAEATDADAEALVAGGAVRPTRINLRGLRNRQPAQQAPAPAASAQLTIRDVAFASTETGGFGVGEALDFVGMGEIVDRRLMSFNAKQYENAALLGTKMRQQFGIATIRKPQGEFVISEGASKSEVDAVLDRVTDMSALPGGSLVASGGWCAPSEILYDIYDCGEVADGLLSTPTIGMPRGGVQYNRGVGFNELLTQSGFFYTEEQDITGEDYPKPCFKIPCIEFDEARMDLEGLCLQAGLLQARGYPEVIADTIRKALIAHEIRMDSRKIATIVAGSTAVTIPSDQVGAAAPILTAIELQATHYRQSGALADTTVLEVVFPQWVRGVIRSDLSRRLGVDLLSVSNADITRWFADRQVAPQFVANWQSVGTIPASGFTEWPDEVDFLLYKAGTWITGSSDVITLENVYDSTLLAENDYTALFTEEGVVTFRRGCDSRVVTVPICPNGNTGGGVEIDCDGTAIAA